MSQFHHKFVTNCLNDETNLVQAVPILLPSILNVSSAEHDAAGSAKVHTRLSALLQSKDTGLRWAGTCLVKGMLERDNGRWETLISHGSTWMKLLLRNLEREDSEPVVERTIGTIRTMVRMTDGKPSLTRDLTTPALPTFFTHVFAILQKGHISRHLVKSILFHLHESLLAHPTTFRPFAGKLQAFVSNHFNGSSPDQELTELAANCYASLHLCAPKNTAAEQWSAGLLAVLGECHATCSYIFQTVVEQKPSLTVPAGMEMLLFSNDYVAQISLAVRRLEALIKVVAAFLTLSTKEIVKLPVGQLIMLIQRILAINSRSGIRATTPQASQVALISILPQLHEMTLGLTKLSFETLGRHLGQHAAVLQPLLIVDCHSMQNSCRIAAFEALTTSIAACGVTLNDKSDLTRLFQVCNSTIKAIVAQQGSGINARVNGNGHAQGQGQKKRKHAGNEGSDQVSHDAAFHTSPPPKLVQSMIHFLQIIFTTTHDIMSKGIRQQIDTTTLQLLNTHSAQLSADMSRMLLALLASSLRSSQSAASASAVLSAGLTTISNYTASDRPETRHLAIDLRDELELLIHPRFPAIRKRTQQSTIIESNMIVDVPPTLDDDPVLLEENPRAMEEETHMPTTPREPAFPVPATYPEPLPVSTAATPTTHRTENPRPNDEIDSSSKKQKLTEVPVLDEAEDGGSDDEIGSIPEINTDSDTEEEEEDVI